MYRSAGLCSDSAQPMPEPAVSSTLSMKGQQVPVAIALGSNLGDREANLKEAIRRIGRVARLTAVSGFYDTAPVGFLDQPRFLNAALTLSTSLSPEALLNGLLQIEREMGRVRAVDASPKGPRLIDLDLLLYGKVILTTETLCIPHPEMLRRRFVLEPLAEIASNWPVPGAEQTVNECLAATNKLS
jgi:2-amino-4-hydroxy-6-hydroxymethyldihydropteridine diphosphokinase